ncbi:hypothetical protein IQ260_19310 [Leptolyngbya cf. ectocarpi LEGE 11479]|uniref:DUF928 domain-containing protein n=1 Tax=Leptolyngbya cf. ectocarpi LEGE 11479 TaxID=1828722 RepID=A0A929FB34_LEPEC|nr:hypothetical protein [Leptolyngbya ectocarpi]MBE9068797.1 hypothetical protein [Leptolyngbya cf. ectocarpi LEGE 11479]
MNFEGKSICQVGVITGLMLAIGLAADVQAQQASYGFLKKLDKVWDRVVRDDEHKEPPQSSQASSGIRNRLENIWSRIVRQDEYKEPPQTSRGDLCAIAPSVPGAETSTIWHNQPVIALQPGSVEKVSLRVADSEEAFWDYVLSDDDNHVVYDGEPLMPGQTYVVGLHAIADFGPTSEAEFEVLPTAIRALINNGLRVAVLEDDPIFEAVSDSEKQAIQQAEYFAERGLPYDAIQAMFSVSSPSAALLAGQEQMLKETCQPAPTD